MSALQTPATNAPASECGRLAVSIPGWRSPQLPCMPYLLSPSQTSNVPDPAHWAWEGWMLRLLGNERWRLHLDDVGEWSFWVHGPPQTHGTGHRIHVGESLGRACIAVAAALGRWPGGQQTVFVAHSMTARPGEDAVPTAALGRWPGGEG